MLDLHRHPAGHAPRSRTTCGREDAAGNVSANSNTVTRTGSGTGGTNLARRQADRRLRLRSSRSSPTNANDNDVATYWEGASGAYPSTLTVTLGANASDQLGRASSSTRTPPGAPVRRRSRCSAGSRARSAFTSLVGSATLHLQPGHRQHGDHPGHRDRRRRPALRSPPTPARPAGQVAEFQVIGTPAPNPDLTVTGAVVDARPRRSRPTRSRCRRPSATAARRPSGATNVNFYLGTTKVGTAAVGALAAGASTHRHGEHRHPGRRHLPAERQGRRGEHGHRAERGQQQPSPTRPPSSSARSPSSDLVASAVAGRRATRRPATRSPSRWRSRTRARSPRRPARTASR